MKGELIPSNFDAQLATLIKQALEVFPLTIDGEPVVADNEIKGLFVAKTAGYYRDRIIACLKKVEEISEEQARVNLEGEGFVEIDGIYYHD